MGPIISKKGEGLGRQVTKEQWNDGKDWILENLEIYLVTKGYFYDKKIVWQSDDGETYPHRFEFSDKLLQKEEQLEISSRFGKELIDTLWAASHTKKIRQIHIGTKRLHPFKFLSNFEDDSENLGKRNPKWNKNELLLAVTFYDKYPYPEWKDFPKEEVEFLREKINQVSEAERTYASVYLKLRNFVAINPNDERKGMENYGKTDEEVWKKYQTGELLPEVLENIKSDVLDVDEIEYTAKEGKRTKSESAHYRYERDPKLRKLKIKEFLTNYDTIHCEICGFDFEAKYGERGREYIECHHTIPVSEMKESHISKISELILLCSNCHRMVHRKKPWLAPDELRNIVKK
jgi:5-methylcytosine-specific restriction protein A